MTPKRPSLGTTPTSSRLRGGSYAGRAARKMSINEIINEIIRLVRARDTNGGHFHDEPYKGDFFRLFIAAWDAGLLKRAGPKSLKLDSLIRIVGDRDPAIFDGDTWLMFLRCMARVGLRLVAGESGAVRMMTPRFEG